MRLLQAVLVYLLTMIDDGHRDAAKPNMSMCRIHQWASRKTARYDAAWARPSHLRVCAVFGEDPRAARLVRWPACDAARSLQAWVTKPLGPPPLVLCVLKLIQR